LRIDNADRRLTPHGRRNGLIGDEAWTGFQAKQERARKLMELLEKTRLSGEMLEKIERAQRERLAVLRSSKSNDLENESETAEASGGAANAGDLSSALGSTLAQLLRRPEIVIEDLAGVVRESCPEYFAEIETVFQPQGLKPSSLPAATARLKPGPDTNPSANGSGERGSSTGVAAFPALSSAARNEMKTVETEIKYAGYLDQQRKSIERLKKAEQRVIPEWFDYSKVSGLSREMNEKLQRVRPRTLGHASRIPGVTPAAVSLIHVYIEIQGRSFSAANARE
jgi:tRNA uridine 5-carboxymethylaminomethyl modification enzyme